VLCHPKTSHRKGLGSRMLLIGRRRGKRHRHGRLALSGCRSRRRELLWCKRLGRWRYSVALWRLVSGGKVGGVNDIVSDCSLAGFFLIHRHYHHTWTKPCVPCIHAIQMHKAYCITNQIGDYKNLRTRN
jgi:hypothetical protein